MDNNAATRTTGNVILPRAEYERLLQLEQRVELLTKKLEEANASNEWLWEQIRNFQRNRFGSKALDTSEEAAQYYQLLFNEAELTADAEQEEASKENTKAEKTIKVDGYTRKCKSGSLDDVVPEGTRVETVEHTLPPEDRTCSECGSPMEVIGKETVRTLKVIPAEVYIQEDIYYTYACPNCETTTGKANIVNTPKEQTFLPGGFASPELVSFIMDQKYVMGSPLYRQEQEFKRKNIFLSRQTMSNWLVNVPQDWFLPVYMELHRLLLLERIVHADETVLQVLRELGKTAQSKSYMWLYRTGKYAEHAIVLYDYQPDRSQKNPQEFLKGFSGFLSTDGYQAYNAVEGVIHVGCLQHVRAKFVEAEKDAPKNSKPVLASKAIAYCNRVFAIEEELDNLSCQERYEQRDLRVRPVLEELLLWAEHMEVTPRSKLGKAMTYLKNQMPKVKNYLLDGNLEPSNNIAERSIKSFVIDRKNFLFANTPLGADSSAITFSLIESAKENGLVPYKYLVYVLTTAPTLDRTKPDWVTPLLPWNAPEECRAPKS